MSDRTVSVKLQAVVGDYMAKMSAAGKATSDLANKVDTAKGRSQQGFQMMGRAALLGGAAIGAGFAYAVKSAADFDAKMALVQTLSHASSAEMGQLHDAALTVGQAWGFTAGQVADAEAELVKAGVSVKDIMGGALTGALTLAAAGQTDVAEATQTAAIAMTQFKLTGKDVPHIADLLAAGADKALGSVGDLSYALESGGLVAAQFGLSIDDTVGSLAAFAQAGLIGERGGTTLRQMLLQLTAPSKQASDIMQQLGIHTYTTAGQFVGITNLAGQLHGKLASLTQAERDHALAVIFGSRAIQGANVLYEEGAKGLQGWIDRVNDAGFAELQAAGKMDSLSGDVTKLKSALQAAFIGVGEGASGPLREIVQDVTEVINVWNDLPGPVKAGAEALILAGGAVSFLGGAAILFIPKWTAMNAALKESGRSAISARGALMGVGKVAGAAVGLAAVYEGVKAIHNATAETGPSVETFTADLIDMGNSGVDSANLLLNALSVIADLPFGLIGNFTDNLDTALSNLVTSGHADMAAQDFTRISETLKDAGHSTAEITKLFPGYSKALASSADEAALAADGTDSYGNAVGAAATQTKAATDALKAYKDQLHAMSDPLFAMNTALQDLHDKQAAATSAVSKYGASSKQARQANLDLASSALDVKAAAADLATAVATGDVKLGEAKQTMRDWAAQGLITKNQADDIIASFGGLITKAQRLSDVHPKVTVTANTTAFNIIDAWLAKHHSITIPLTVQPTTGQVIPHGLASGGPVYGVGTGTSDSNPYLLSRGEFVVRADGSNLDAASRFFGQSASMVPSVNIRSTEGRGGVTYHVENHYPEPERASDAVPRVLREVAYVEAVAW